MRPGEQLDCLATAIAPLLATRDPALGGLERAFCIAVPTRVEDACAIRERGECLNAKVYPALLSCEREWLRWNLGAGDARVPSIRFPTDRDRLGDAFQWTMEPNADATNLREANYGSIQDSAIAVLRKGEAIVASPALEAWIARCLTSCDAAEERLEGAVKPQDDILQDVSVNLTERWTRRFESGQFGLLLVITSPNALSAFPPEFALFQCDIVERATS